MHSTKIMVRPDTKNTSTIPKDTYWIAYRVDGESVPEFPVTIRRDDQGFPSQVYIKGAYPFYETWVYNGGELIAHSKGMTGGIHL